MFDLFSSSSVRLQCIDAFGRFFATVNSYLCVLWLAGRYPCECFAKVNLDEEFHDTWKKKCDNLKISIKIRFRIMNFIDETFISSKFEKLLNFPSQKLSTSSWNWADPSIVSRLWMMLCAQALHSMLIKMPTWGDENAKLLVARSRMFFSIYQLVVRNERRWLAACNLFGSWMERSSLGSHDEGRT